MKKDLNISVVDSVIVDESIATMNTNEVKKILERMLANNLPVPAVLVTCCFIDALSKNSKDNGHKSFIYYIKTKMPETFKQFGNNDKLRAKQLSQLNCKDHIGKCNKSVNILYNHIRHGLVHNYFQAKQGAKIINKPNQSSKNIVIDQGHEYKNLALVLNAPAFVREFTESLD